MKKFVLYGSIGAAITAMALAVPVMASYAARTPRGLASKPVQTEPQLGRSASLRSAVLPADIDECDFTMEIGPNLVSGKLHMHVWINAWKCNEPTDHRHCDVTLMGKVHGQLDLVDQAPCEPNGSLNLDPPCVRGQEYQASGEAHVIWVNGGFDEETIPPKSSKCVQGH